MIRKITLTLLTVVSLCLSFSVPPASAADNEPSDLALLLQEAFSHPNSPGRGDRPISSFSMYDGVPIAFNYSSLYVYDGTNWIELEADNLFDKKPGQAFSLFETSCSQMGIKKGEVIGFWFYQLIGIKTTFGIFEPNAGETPLYSLRVWEGPYGGVEPVLGVASLDCMVVLLTERSYGKPEMFHFIAPDPEQPGKFPFSATQSEGLKGVVSELISRNGADGFLDGYIAPEEVIGGIELTRNEHGNLALITVTDKKVYLFEFEQARTVVTEIPLQ